MIKITRYFATVFYILWTFNVPVLYAQNKKLDSLYTELKRWENKEGIQADSVLYNIYYSISSQVKNSNPDTTIYFLNRGISRAKNMRDEVKIADANRLIGWCNFVKGNKEEALKRYKQTLDTVENYVNDSPVKKRALPVKAGCLDNIGSLYRSDGNYALALDYFFKALKIFEGIDDKKGMATDLTNIGNVYLFQKQYEKCLSYYLRALNFFQDIHVKQGQAITLGNIGVVYKELHQYNKALENSTNALNLYEELGNKAGIATNLGNIGIVYCDLGEYAKSLEYYFKALELTEQMGNKPAQALHLTNIGELYIKQKKYKEAQEYINKSMVIASSLNLRDHLISNYFNLSDLYNQTNRPKEALEAYKKYILYRDSSNSEENKKASVQKEMQFEFDKKQSADSVKVVEERKVTTARLAQEKTQRYALYGGLLLVFLFALFMFNRFKVTQKQKNIIELKEKETQEQKHIIEEKHKEITDSINYAERIQKSFLASKKLLDDNLGDYFVFFHPKDVVSGDFYWAATLTGGHFALAAADSTGHGVPGAIMSILNISSLEKSIETNHEPAAILNSARKIIIERLKKDGSEQGGKDGMDVSLIILNREKTILSYAAANNPVLIVRDKEVTELQADKMPVGKHDKDDVSFTRHTFILRPGDMIYCATDGFPDQFGGPKGKKFMFKKMKELLSDISGLSPYEQHQRISKVFKEWKGNLEQVDDVTIVGIRV